MTKRSELAQRRAEAQAKMLSHVVNRAMSKKTTGLDRVAKALVARQAGTVDHDPELDHD